MLDELRSLSEEKKKQVLIIATIIIMVIIIGIWIAYFNNILTGPSEQSQQQAAQTAASSSAPTAPAAPATTSAPAVATPGQASGPGLWQNIGNWFGSVFSSFANIFRNPSQYNIQPQGN